MKKLISSLFLCFAFLDVHGQVNLVPNPSFEDYTNCPTGIGQTIYLIDWNDFRGSPDYFNSCAPMSSYYSVPSNASGYQQAASGNAYAGIICFDNSIFSREVIANSLIAPLTIGQKYFITFNVSKADDASVVGYSINKIGAKFSTVTHSNVSIDNTAHIYTNSVISDTVNWTRIAGSYIADSAYNYLMIGNFFDDANTTVVNNSTGFWAYYLVDDVCVSTDSLFCENWLGLDENNKSNLNQISIFPNPVNDILHIESEKPIEKVAVYNSFSQLIFTKENFPNVDYNLNLEQIDAGIYFVKIRTQSSEVVQKISVN